MERILGIDYGEKRIGLAISDPLGLFAQGLETLERTTLQNDVAHLRKLVEDRDVKAIVVGLPRNMDDTDGPQSLAVREFAEDLAKQLSLPLHLVDERLTTARAERELSEADVTPSRRREHVDRMAAQFILQSFLDSQRNQARRKARDERNQ